MPSARAEVRAREELVRRRSPQAGRGRDSATGACAGTARAADAARPAGPAGTAAPRGRRRGGCPRAERSRGCPPRASASRIARTWLVGRQYQSIAARGSTSRDDSGPFDRIRSRSSSTSGACSSNAPPSCSDPLAVPGDPVPGQLGRRHDRQHLVVRLEQATLLVQQRVRPLAPVAVDPGEQHEVVVATGDVERVELERPEPVHDRHDAGRLGGQRPRRRQQVVEHEEAAGDVARDLDRRGPAAVQRVMGRHARTIVARDT